MKYLLQLALLALPLLVMSGCGGPKMATDPPEKVKAATDNAANMTTGVPTSPTMVGPGGAAPPPAKP